ncbi:hypothetical protein X777_04693, partial [Ooceraea biroi]
MYVNEARNANDFITKNQLVYLCFDDTEQLWAEQNHIRSHRLMKNNSITTIASVNSFIDFIEDIVITRHS